MLEVLTSNPTVLLFVVCCLFPAGCFTAGWVLRGLYIQRGLPRVSWSKESQEEM